MKAKLLNQDDVREVVRFQEYMRDLESDMTPEDFAVKYYVYLGLSESEARNYFQWKRVKP